MLRAKSSKSSIPTSKVKSKRKIKEILSRFRYPAILLFFVVLIFFAHQRFFLIAEITCTSEDHDCSPELTYRLNQYRGKSLLWLNQEKIKSNLKDTGLVDNAAVTFGLPGKMKIQIWSVTERFPMRVIISDIPVTLLTFLSTESGTPKLAIELENYTATQSGVDYQLLSTGTLSESEAKDSTLVYIGRSLPNRETCLKIFDWLKAISFAKISFQSTYFYENLIVADDTNWDVVYDLNTNPTEGLFALQQLRPVATIREPRVIDFRFKHPILK